MEWLGVWNCIFSGSEFSNFGAWNLAKIALSAEFQGFSGKIRPLKNIFRTLENGHSIRHQSIPPLSAGRIIGWEELTEFSPWLIAWIPPHPDLPGNWWNLGEFGKFGKFQENLVEWGFVNPKGPNLEKIQDRLKFSISLENFNLAWNFQSWPPEFPTKNRGLVGGSLENFKLAWKFQDLEIFQDLGP